MGTVIGSMVVVWRDKNQNTAALAGGYTMQVWAEQQDRQTHQKEKRRERKKKKKQT